MDLIMAAEHRHRQRLWSEECMLFSVSVLLLLIACYLQGWPTDYWMDRAFPGWLLYELPRALLFALAGPAFLVFRMLRTTGMAVTEIHFVALLLIQAGGMWYFGREWLLLAAPQRRWSLALVACGFCGAAALATAPAPPAWKVVLEPEQANAVEVLVRAEMTGHGASAGNRPEKIYLAFGGLEGNEANPNPTSKFLSRFEADSVSVLPIGALKDYRPESVGQSIFLRIHCSEIREKVNLFQLTIPVTVRIGNSSGTRYDYVLQETNTGWAVSAVKKSRSVTTTNDNG